MFASFALPILIEGEQSVIIEVYGNDTILQIKKRIAEKGDHKFLHLKYCFTAECDGNHLFDDQRLCDLNIGPTSSLSFRKKENKQHFITIYIDVFDRMNDDYQLKTAVDKMTKNIDKTDGYTIDWDFCVKGWMFQPMEINLDFVKQIPNILEEDEILFWDKYTIFHGGKSAPITFDRSVRFKYILDFMRDHICRCDYSFSLKTHDGKMYYRQKKIKEAEPLLIFGFIRQHIEDKYNLNIPTMLQRICLAHAYGKQYK